MPDGARDHQAERYAESQGFEPWVGYKPTHDFQSCLRPPPIQGGTGRKVVIAV